MVDQTSHRLRIPGFSRLVLLLACLLGGGLIFLALVSRVYGFWFLSRWPRLFLFGIGALVCSLLVGLLFRSAWSRLAAAPRAGKLLWLGVAFAAGISIGVRVGLQPPAIPILYVLDISTPGASALAASGQKAGPVVFIELRDNSGRTVLLDDIRMEGDWQRNNEGWVARSDQPARLHYSYYAPTKGKLQVLFEENPGSGQVQVLLNGENQTIDLNSPAWGQRLVELPFQQPSRWEKPILIADMVMMGLALPLLLYVVPFYILDAARWSWPRLRSAVGWLYSGLDYQKVFIVIFLGICVLPFFDYKGDFSTLETFFLQGNRFWTVYSKVRQNIFGDRFIGGALVGEDGWLALANDFSLEDYQNSVPLDEEELFQIQQRIDGTTRFLKKQGITFLVVITPNKNTIYSDQMPSQIEVIGKQSRLDQLLEYQRLHGEAQILDLRPALMEARKEHLVYHKTDTHWNDYGAHAAYVEIMEVLQNELPEFPGLKPHMLDEYRYEPGNYSVGDMGRRWAQGVQKESFFSLEPLFERQLLTHDSYQDRVMYSYRYNQLDANLPNAIVFHDSFMDWLAPFLTDHFQRSAFVRALDLEKGMDDHLIEAEKPDIVIYECNERLLRVLKTFSSHLSSQE